MRIAVCDDEQIIMDATMIMIEEIIDECSYIGEFYNFNSGQELLKSLEEDFIFFDIYILDINLNDINGIEVAKRIRGLDNDAIIIFLTSYQEWMAEAFDVQAFHYLLKPIDRKKLEGIFKKIFNYLSDRKILYYFKQGKKLYSIPYKNIYYFESDKRKMKIFTGRGEYYYYDTIANVEKTVRMDLFTRTHVSYLVNMDHIRSFDGKDVTLENGLRIPASKKYVELFNINFMKYLKRRI
ncbi:LytR/AlgR family response regulator transcription factor [Clostridium saccharobutylicum]|uniref:Stage 0 sporulation protein A homolog n=1 Tax=Clostridium saccharobutylicum TaxID=169679 RepID=A0A1S8NJQ1_CLOSA|nr:LytTR family DNA-binding domain-containing protein [Clostridium saccharobutylicum]OOM16686.1 transcriptional regulatory protein YehT [Clostridium saccharobutylicum]